MSPLVVGLDIATDCGVAYGRPSDCPKCLSWDLREGGKGRSRRLAQLWDYLHDFCNVHSPDMLFYEAGMGLQTALGIGTSEETFAFLRGAIGVVEACAIKAKIPYIKSIGVQDARKHLLGAGRLPKGEGKKLVFDRCRALRWPVTNEDESDACAIWSLGCGEANPLSSAMVTPLFSGAPR